MRQRRIEPQGFGTSIALQSVHCQEDTRQNCAIHDSSKIWPRISLPRRSGQTRPTWKLRVCVKFRIFISFPCDLLDKSMKFSYTEDEGARSVFICTLPHPHWNRVRIWMRFFLFSPSFCRITVFGNLIFCSIDISPARGYTCKYKRKNECSIIVR